MVVSKAFINRNSRQSAIIRNTFGESSDGSPIKQTLFNGFTP